MGRFEKAREESKQRRASGGGGGANYLKVPDEGEIQIRMLEDFDEIEASQGAYFHRTPKGYNGSTWGWQEICLDQDENGDMSGQDCKGCEEEADGDGKDFRRRFVAYINVIWRDQPVRKKNSKGKWEETDEVSDQVALWEVSQESAQNAIFDANLTYKSLTNRDFVLRRRGEGFDTTYSLNPVVDDQGDPIKKALTKADKELAENKPDLTAKVAKKDNDEWGKVADKKDGKGAPEKVKEDSPFLNRNKKKDAEEDDE